MGRLWNDSMSRLFKGRTGIVARNILLSGFLKGGSILVSFLLVPLCLKAVSQKEYGIILTVTAIASWITYFDIGIGNGLRNKLGKAIAEHDLSLQKQYVSTAYFYIAIILSCLYAVYFLIHPFIEWHNILNIAPTDVPLLNASIAVILGIFTLRFILQLISVILLSNQQSALSDSIQFVSGILNITIISILYYLNKANFHVVLFSICASPLVVFALYSVVLYKGKFTHLRPSLKDVNHSLRKDLLSLGLKFFVLQIIVLIIFSTADILIANLFEIKDVTTYKIASQYYGVPMMLFNIIAAPLWGAFTNAWYQNDIKWIHNTIKRMLLVNVSLLALSVLLFLLYPVITPIWLGRENPIAIMLAFGLITFNFQIAFNNIFSFFLNSIGRINLQLIAAIIGGIINIPLTIFLARHTQLGLASVCIASICSLLPSSIITAIQTKRLLDSRLLKSRQPDIHSVAPKEKMTIL